MNWLFYDTIYTERFMDLPSQDDNQAGYDRGSVLNKIDNFRNKNYMINHGTADDNVHYQQSMMLIKALELNDIVFKQQSFPDQFHGISEMTEFLYNSMENFWLDCFGLN